MIDKNIDIENIEKQIAVLRKNIGNLLSQARNTRGISQEAIYTKYLKSNGNTYTISRNRLQSIEAGNVGIKVDELMLILSALKTKPSVFFLELLPLFKEEEEEEEEEEVGIIVNLLNEQNFKDAENRFNNIKDKLVSEKGRRFVLWCQGVLANRLHNKKDEAQQFLLEALAISLPKVVNTKGKKLKLNMDKADKLDFKESEMAICMELVSTKDTYAAVHMCEYLISRLETNMVMTKAKASSFIVMFYFNISSILLEEYKKNKKNKKLDKKILDVCEKGLAIEKSLNSYEQTGKLYYNIGVYYSYKNDKKTAKKFFQQSYMFWIVIREYEIAEKTLQWTRDEHQIELDPIKVV